MPAAEQVAQGPDHPHVSFQKVRRAARTLGRDKQRFPLVLADRCVQTWRPGRQGSQ